MDNSSQSRMFDGKSTKGEFYFSCTIMKFYAVIFFKTKYFYIFIYNSSYQPNHSFVQLITLTCYASQDLKSLNMDCRWLLVW